MCEILPTYIERDKPGSLLIVPRAPLGLPDMAYAAIDAALHSEVDGTPTTAPPRSRPKMICGQHFETVVDPYLKELDHLDS